MSEAVKTRKKLIEVALPLEAINTASAREKAIRHGHPSTLHLWWARRPLAAARAVIFSQMVDDPSSRPEQFRTSEAQEKERQRLFRIIEELVKWENTANEEVLAQAREEIWKCWRLTCADNHDHAKDLFNPDKLPAFHDPFAGGGTLPLEAQRLGLESYASDLNPVAVLINKAMIEVPPRFAGKPPVNPDSRNDKRLIQKQWRAVQGLAEDVRYYGRWMRDEAEKRIGNLYPKVEITKEIASDRPDLKPLIGKNLRVIAWIWARTVKSPNPAFAHVDVPLASTFLLSTNRAGKTVYVEPMVEHDHYRFIVKVGTPLDAQQTKLGTTAGKRAAFRCLMSGVPITYDHIRAEGKAHRMGAKLMAIVVEGDGGRVYLAPTGDQEAVAFKANPEWKPENELPENPRDFKTPNYGLTTFAELFTARQLVALTTFSDLVKEARERVKSDAASSNTFASLQNATSYGDAVALYLGFAVDKLSDRHSTLCRWDPTPTASGIINTFSRQALPMTWDYAEGNPFSDASGNFDGGVGWIAKVIDTSLPASPKGAVSAADASSQNLSLGKVVSTDPPYYDNIGYADLSDFLYIWLRRSLKSIFPDLFATLAVPKAEELVATPYRHGSKAKAEEFFLQGMTRAMHRLAEQSHEAFPITIYYAFKQSESEGDEGTSSTGWETFLDAVIRAGFAISGTWPVRTELANKVSGIGHNMLASSIVLVCRKCPPDATSATRRDFVSQLKSELPVALARLQHGNIAPVDLAQAAIGPGMAVYTRHSKVIDASGKPLTVRQALALIIETLEVALAHQEGDFDADSRWALAWFEQCGFEDGEYGVAETLSKAKNTSIAGMADAGILRSKGGKVRLLRPDELSNKWDPATDSRLTAWEIVHQLVRVLAQEGEATAARIANRLGSKADVARELAYRLYTLCERKKRAQEALAYNSLVQSWPEIMRLALEGGAPRRKQAGLFEKGEE